MNAGSTLEKDLAIRNQLVGGNCKGYVLVEYWDEDAAEWYVLNDLDVEAGLEWTQGGRRDIYQHYSLTPTASTLTFKVVNVAGIYSEGSGISDGILVPDRLVRVRAGYRLPGAGAMTPWALSLTAGVYKWGTLYASGHIELDGAYTSGLPEVYFNDLTTPRYDSVPYDSANYAAAPGYWIATRDLVDVGTKIFSSISVTCDAGLRVYWTADYSPTAPPGLGTSAGWTLAGIAAGGTTVFNIAAPRSRYLHVAVVWADCSPGAILTACSAGVRDDVEYIYTSAFLLDTITFPEPPAPEVPRVECMARDVYKRVMDNEGNLPDVSGLYIHEMIKYLCDAVQVPYSADSIADLTAYGTRTLALGLGTNMKLDELFAKIMQFLNQSGAPKYKIFIQWNAAENKNILYVQPRAEDFNSVFGMNYRYYTSLGQRGKNYDKVISRITVFDKAPQVLAEVLADSLSITTAGDYTANLPVPYSFIYKRVTQNIITPGMSVTITDVAPGHITFHVTGTGHVGIQIYGCPMVAEPAAWGEWLNFNNSARGKGANPSLTNPMLKTSAEAHLIAHGFMEDYGEPGNLANDLQYPYIQLIPENNDLVLLMSRYNYDSNLYRITNVRHAWNVLYDNSSFNMEDSGLSFRGNGGVIYDSPFVKYDIGEIYDYNFGPFVTDEYILAHSLQVKDTEF